MIYLLALVVSFCSISYQILISKTLLQFSTDEVFSQSLTLGVYLASMGIGAFVADHFFQKSRQVGFVVIEFILSILGSVAVPLIYILSVFFMVFNQDQSFSDLFSPDRYYRIIFFQIFTFAIGFLTGFEIPILNALNRTKTGRDSLNTFLGISYVGTVIGSFLIPLWIIPRVDLITVGVFVSFFNLICLAGASWLFLKRTPQRVLGLFLLALGMFVNYSVLTVAPKVTQIYKKAYYADVSFVEFNLENIRQAYRLFNFLKPIETYSSVYQMIDIVPANLAPAGAEIFQEFAKDFSLYLNMAPQFSENTYKFYHESMVFGGINLNKTSPQKVLILGGGDGLLVAELLKIPSVEKIVLVELDPLMIHIAKTHPVISRFNQRALEDAKVEVIVGDAFHYIRNTKESFDAILVDFPFPASYELGRLFSIEFYSVVIERLRDNGYVIADIPLLTQQEAVKSGISPTPQEIMVNTMLASGFKSLVTFGPMDGFVFAKKETQSLRFDYEKLPDEIDFRTRLNLNAFELENLKLSPEFVNSVYKPQRFRWR